MSNTIMSEWLKLIIIGKFSILLAACGGGDSSSDSNISITTIDTTGVTLCEYECATSSLSFDGKSVDIANTPFEQNDQTNASITIEVHQDIETDNFVFKSMSENLSTNNSFIQTVATQFNFGVDFYPALNTSYGLADAKLVYNYTNNAVPFIWFIQFRIETADGDVYEGTAKTGEIVAARTFLPDEYTGNKLSNFEFTLLESTVENDIANLKYKFSFNFDSNGATHQFEQILFAQNNSVIANHIPRE